MCNVVRKIRFYIQNVPVPKNIAQSSMIFCMNDIDRLFNKLNYTQVKFGVNSSISFECDFVRMVHIGPYETETETDHID